MVVVGIVAAIGVAASVAVGLSGRVGTAQRAGAYVGPAVVNGCAIKAATSCPGVDLSNTDLRNADLAGADLTGAELRGTALAGAKLTGAKLSKADLTGATATGASFAKASISGAVFDGVTGDLADFSGMFALGTRFVGARLTTAAFVDTHLDGADFSGANLAQSVWLRSGLGNSTLTGADLTGAEYVDSSMTWSSLASARLTGAQLQGSEFHKVDFTGADLSGADLGTVYNEHNRPPVKLRADTFAGADLTGANLTRVDVSETTFTGADFTRTNLSRARGIRPDAVSGAVFANTRMPNLTTASALDPAALQYLATEFTPDVVGVSVQHENYLCGSLSCPDPGFFVTVHSGGTKLDVNAVVVGGCVAFGNQTRTYNLTGDTYHPFKRRDTVSWTAGVASNICLDSVYKVRVRVRDDGGITSPWTDFVVLQASGSYRRPCITCDVFSW